MRAALLDARVQPVVNLCVNPSFETGTTRWTAQSSAIARSTAQQHSGSGSLLITLTAATGAGAYTSFDQVVGETHTLHAWVLAPAAVSIRAAYTNGTVTSGGGTVILAPNTWTRITVGGKATAAIGYLSILTTTPPAAGALLYVDDVMLGPDVSYADGNSPGWRWLGTPNNSQSVGYPVNTN